MKKKLIDLAVTLFCSGPKKVDDLSFCSYGEFSPSSSPSLSTPPTHQILTNSDKL